ncbi:hypothetical protein PROFUN_16659, partial [Planoprotostelium fungivorum]
LAHGNITEEQAVTTVNEIKNIFAGVPMSDSEFHEDRIVRLERGKEYVYSSPIPNPNESNSAVYVYYQIGLENRREDALLDVLNQIFDSTFYDQLRTKEQLGYIVWSGSRSHSNVQGFKIEVQSSKFTPKYLGERIEACLQLCKTTLDNLTEEEFNKVVSVVVSFKREKTKRLEEETSRMWGEINTHDYLFVRDELEVEELQKLKLEELREFFHHHIFHTQTRAKMTVERYSHQWISEYEKEDRGEQVIRIDNIVSFKHSMQLWPSDPTVPKEAPEPPAEAVVEGKQRPQVDLEEMDRSQFEHRLNHLVSRATEMQRRDGRSAVSSEALTKMNVFPKDRTKDMNLDGAYLRDGSNFRNQREFVQNFVDQCRLLNQGLEPRMMFEQIPSQLTNTDGLNVWRLYDSASQVSRNSRQLLNFLQILGSIYETIVAGVPVHTSLNNYNTVLDPVIRESEDGSFILQHVEAQPPHDSYPEFVTALRVSYYDTREHVLRHSLRTGEAAVLPHTKSQEKEKEEAEYLQYKTYLVSDVMYSFIEPSRHMVTLEKLWAIKREDLWKLPDGVTKNEAETRVVQGLIETLRKCFTHSSEEEFHVFFKVFPRGNHLLVIDIPHTDVQGKPIFGRKPRSWVIDFQYLSRTEMHRWMEVQQATICTSDTCFCVRKQMVATFLEILQKRGIQMGSILVNLLDKAVQETQDPADLPEAQRASQSWPNGSSGETVMVHQQEKQEKRTVEDLAKAEIDLNQLLSDTQKQSHLFYNLRYYEVLHLKKSRGKAKCWWLVVFAHEVAHNVAPGHNKHHEFMEEMILQEHIFKLLNRWDD